LSLLVDGPWNSAMRLDLGVLRHPDHYRASAVSDRPRRVANRAPAAVDASMARGGVCGIWIAVARCSCPRRASQQIRVL